MEEEIVPVEEFPAQVRLLLSGKYVLIQVYVLFIRLIIAGFLFAILSYFGILGLVLGTAVIIVYIGIPFWAVFVKARRRTQGWLRFEGTSIVVRTGADWTSILPRAIEWRDLTVFVLRGSGTKHELSFPTVQDANQASLRIKSSLPGIQEILADMHRQDPADSGTPPTTCSTTHTPDYRPRPKPSTRAERTVAHSYDRIV